MVFIGNSFDFPPLLGSSYGNAQDSIDFIILLAGLGCPRYHIVFCVFDFSMSPLLCSS